MIQVHHYLNFNGTAEEAFNFYKSVFGGEFTAIQRFKEVPPQPDSKPLSEADGEKLMHISLPVGNTILMATDAMESMGQKLTMGNNFYISLTVDSRPEADELFSKLSAGGKIEMQMTDMFWGDYFGMFADKFGVQWMIATTAKT